MNRYIVIRRLMGPAILLLIGVLALLHQFDVISNFWRLFWPLLLILIGVIKLAERAALASDGYPPYMYGPGGGPGATPAQPGTPAATGTSIVPANADDYINRGGQS